MLPPPRALEPCERRRIRSKEGLFGQVGDLESRGPGAHDALCGAERDPALPVGLESRKEMAAFTRGQPLRGVSERMHQHVDVVARPRRARERGAQSLPVPGHELVPRGRARARDQPAERSHARLIVGHQQQLVARMELDDPGGATAGG